MNKEMTMFNKKLTTPLRKVSKGVYFLKIKTSEDKFITKIFKQ